MKNFVIVSSNKSSYQILQNLMQAGKLLIIERLAQDADGLPYLHIKAAKNQFDYYVNDSTLDGVFKYLNTGEVSDFDPNPVEIEEKDSNFKFEIFKGFIENGESPDFIMNRRDYPNFLTFKKFFKNGSMTFTFKRTDEIVEIISELEPEYYL